MFLAWVDASKDLSPIESPASRHAAFSGRVRGQYLKGNLRQPLLPLQNYPTLTLRDHGGKRILASFFFFFPGQAPGIRNGGVGRNDHDTTIDHTRKRREELRKLGRKERKGKEIEGEA